MNLGTVVPLLSQAAVPVLKEVLSSEKSASANPSPSGWSSTAVPGLDVRASVAETEMRDPNFWRPPRMDWEKAMVVALLGLVAGHLVARALR